MEAEQVQNCLSEAGISHVPGPQGSSISYNFHSSSKCFLCAKLICAPWALTSRHCFSLFLLSLLSLQPSFFPYTLPSMPFLWLLCSWDLTWCHLSRGRQSCGREQHSAVHSPWSQARFGWVCSVRRTFLWVSTVLGQPSTAGCSIWGCRMVQKSRYDCPAVLILWIRWFRQKQWEHLSPGQPAGHCQQDSNGSVSWVWAAEVA